MVARTYEGGEDTDAHMKGRERERAGPWPLHSSPNRYQQVGAAGRERPTTGSRGRGGGGGGDIPGYTPTPEDLQLKEVYGDWFHANPPKEKPSRTKATTVTAATPLLEAMEQKGDLLIYDL